jgi:magnesium transporter
MNYFNKALSQFSTSIVNPLYYVTFTTATLCASFILFRGFNTSDAINTMSLLCGFLVIFTGVYLLNLSRGDPEGHRLLNGKIPDEDGIPTDPFSSFSTRRSMTLRRSSLDPHRRSGSLIFDPHRRSGSLTFSPGGNRIPSQESAGLMRSYDVEQGAFGLSDLVEDPEDGENGESTSRRASGEHVTRIKAPVSRKGTNK